MSLTIKDIIPQRTPVLNNLAAIKEALKAAGIEFLAEDEASAGGGPGVRLRD